MTWCEEFVSAYRGAPADRLSAFYDDRLSVFVETGPGWNRPTVGADNVVRRLAELDLIDDDWPVETCQRTRPGDGLLVVVSDGRARRQILIVHQSTGAAVVSVHVYHDDDDDDNDDDDVDAMSFQSRFIRWATSLDRTAFRNYRTAFRTGLSVARQYYAPPPGDRGARWRQYDRVACKFSCVRNGDGGGRVYNGVRSVRTRYARLAFDYRHATLRTVDTCWYDRTAGHGGVGGTSSPSPDNTVVLASGTMPGRRRFVQLFVVDTRTRKILNDVLCVQQQHRFRLSTPSSSFSSSSSPPPSSDFHSSGTDRGSTGEHDEPTAGHVVAIRSRLAANSLWARCSAVKTADDRVQQQTNNNNDDVGKLNPRQLFIGCVPLHVKYGQLKLLFERFGEVTYVKVYEGFNRQTGAKMSYNYAFLFFKDEASVERAIVASPVPLDSNWNLNVSRPHHYAIAVAAAAAVTATTTPSPQ